MATDDFDVSRGLGIDALGLRPRDAQASRRCDYEAAFAAWESVVGREHIRFDAATRTAYARTTLPQGTLPAAVIRPGTTREVQEIVQIANRYGVPIHAVSRGKNWGYGDACASTDGQVIVELTRMNAIREINVDLGYAVIEPGVSQGQMYQFLRENNIPLMLDVTGAGPDASIVGNILQRGFGHTPYGDRFRHTSGFEVILRDGRLINTGFGKFVNAQAARVFPWGLGPWIDGLFTQSDLGIVTSACIWLMPQPEVIEGFALKIDDERNLGELLNSLRRLRMNGTVRSTVHVANDLRVLSARMRYPYERAAGETPLPEELRKQLRQEQGLGSWNMLGATYGADVEVRAARSVIRRELRHVGRVHFFRRRKLEFAKRVAARLQWLPPIRGLAGTISAAGSAFDLLEGIPSAEHLAGALWRLRTWPQNSQGPHTVDLVDSGLIWVSPVLPLEAGAAEKVLNISRPIFAKFGFDFLITMTALTERALCAVMSVNYDKRDADETRQAASCARELRSALSSQGYQPYRDASVR
jgi:4-cresol dehydrogenase (hydroxylating)